jgi:hypothetical protein
MSRISWAVDPERILIESLIVLAAITLSACIPSQPETPIPFTQVALPTVQPTSTSQATFTLAPTPTEAPSALEAMLSDRSLIPWQPEGLQDHYPLTDEIVTQPGSYGAVIDALAAALDRAQADVDALRAGGTYVFVELHWNGINSYSGDTFIEAIYRDAADPQHVLWIGSADSGFTRVEAVDIQSLVADYPGQPPLPWQDPGVFVYLDDPNDPYERGLQLLDHSGRSVGFVSSATGAVTPWLRQSPYRTRLVNGWQSDFYGFEDDDLDILWEAMGWIQTGLEEPGELLDVLVSVRSVNLPLSIAGAAGPGDMQIDPNSLTSFRRNANAPRLTDVIWTAALLVHEARHLNQPGACTESYAASQGMSLEEYALWIETGPGQAYETEVVFLENLLSMRDENGRYLLDDSTTRQIMQSNVTFVRGVLGSDTFPDGTRVPTCAGW